MSPRAAFSFVEVLVATALLVCVLVPLLFLYTQSVRSAEVSLDELIASTAASEMMDQLKVLPFTLPYRNIVSIPVPNPPPDYPEFVEYPPGGIAFPQAWPYPGGPQLPIPMNDWKTAGTTYDLKFGRSKDPVEARGRLYLSAVPEGTRRFLKVHHPLLDPSGAADVNVYVVGLRVDWSRTFLGGPQQDRRCELQTALANPTFNP